MAEEELSNEKPKGDEARALVFGYYTRLHDIVLAKIEHAHTATLQATGDCVSVEDDADPAALEDLRKYDEFWEELIELFKEAGMSLDGLGKIDQVLERLPKIIKKYYDVLVKQDNGLLMLMEELTAKKYNNVREALKIMEATTADEILSFSDVDNYREEGARYILRRASTLPPHNQYGVGQLVRGG